VPQHTALSHQAHPAQNSITSCVRFQAAVISSSLWIFVISSSNSPIAALKINRISGIYQLHHQVRTSGCGQPGCFSEFCRLSRFTGHALPVCPAPVVLPACAASRSLSRLFELCVVSDRCRTQLLAANQPSLPFAVSAYFACSHFGSRFPNMLHSGATGNGVFNIRNWLPAPRSAPAG